VRVDAHAVDRRRCRTRPTDAQAASIEVYAARTVNPRIAGIAVPQRLIEARRLGAQLIERTLPAVAGTTTRASVCNSLYSAARGPGLKCDLRKDRVARAAGWRVAVPAAAAGVAVATTGTRRATLRLTN